MVFGAGTPPGDSSCFTLGFSRFWADTIHGRPRDTHDCDIGLSGNGSGTVGRAVPGRNLIRSGPPARYTHSKTCRPRKPATQTGLEPATFAVTGRRANQLRHWA